MSSQSTPSNTTEVNGSSISEISLGEVVLLMGDKKKAGIIGVRGKPCQNHDIESTQGFECIKLEYDSTHATSSPTQREHGGTLSALDCKGSRRKSVLFRRRYSR